MSGEDSENGPKKGDSAPREGEPSEQTKSVEVLAKVRGPYLSTAAKVRANLGRLVRKLELKQGDYAELRVDKRARLLVDAHSVLLKAIDAEREEYREEHRTEEKMENLGQAIAGLREMVEKKIASEPNSQFAQSAKNKELAASLARMDENWKRERKKRRSRAPSSSGNLPPVAMGIPPPPEKTYTDEEVSRIEAEQAAARRRQEQRVQLQDGPPDNNEPNLA